MLKFEYKFEVGLDSQISGFDLKGRDPMEGALNDLGKQGWELAAVSPCGKGLSHLGFWFKRPLDSK
jgi:hypothetical protein